MYTSNNQALDSQSKYHGLIVDWLGVKRMVPIIEAWLRRRRSSRSNQGRKSSHLGQLLFDQTLISTQSQRAHYFTFSLYPKNFHFIPPSYCFVSLFAAKDKICKSCAAFTAFTTHPSIVRTALAVAHCIESLKLFWRNCTCVPWYHCYAIHWNDIRPVNSIAMHNLSRTQFADKL